MVVYRVGKRSNKLKMMHKNRLNRMHLLSLKSLNTQKDFINNFCFVFKDIRITSFGRVSTILDSRRVSYLMISEFQNSKLSRKKYRNMIFDSELPVYGNLDVLYTNSISDLKRGFFLDVFQTFESTLRQINIALGNKNGSGLFNILNNILNTTGLSTNEKNRAKNFLKFISIIRNSIHNNGVYLPTHGSHSITFPINYSGRSYTLNDYDKVPLNFEILFEVTEDIVTVLEYIIKDTLLNSFVVNSTQFRNIFIEDKTL